MGLSGARHFKKAGKESMTDAEIQSLLELEKKATSRPWEISAHHNDYYVRSEEGVLLCTFHGNNSFQAVKQAPIDQAFIVALRNNCREILEENLRLRDQIHNFKSAFPKESAKFFYREEGSNPFPAVPEIFKEKP